MTRRRALLNLREAQLLWLAVVLLGTLVNYFAISLLAYYENSLAQGLPGVGSSGLSLPIRKLTQTSVLSSRDTIGAAKKLKLKEATQKADANSIGASNSDHESRISPTDSKLKPKASFRDSSRAAEQTDIKNDSRQEKFSMKSPVSGKHGHSNAKRSFETVTLPETQPQKAAKSPRNVELKTIAYYLALSEKEGHDKEKILHLIRDNAKINHMSQNTYDALPTWSLVTSLYGDRPQIIGKEQCQIFQSQGDLADKFLGVAGPFNTGTNLLADALTRNCALHKKQAKYGKKNLGVRWQVPWGKHVPPKDAEFRANNVAEHSKGIDPQQVLPVVMTRDPFRWLYR